MQKVDKDVIETIGIPRLLLMENAGLALARAAGSFIVHKDVVVAVCCGMGYNGGDGLSCARHLHAWGFKPSIFLAGRSDGLRDEPATYARILRRLDVPIKECPDVQSVESAAGALDASGLFIDALLGIGARGPVREPSASLIAYMNRSGKPIISADIPSGLDADTGSVQGIAVKATLTVAFGLLKHGCVRREGPSHTGSLIIDPITIPPAFLK